MIQNFSLWPIVAAPLLGAALAFIVGLQRRNLAGWIATGASGLAFIFVLRAVNALGHDVILEDRLFSWISVGGLSVDFTLRFDQLTAVMCMVVTGVGSLIHLYSTGYMAEDPSRHRFFSYLNLFMFSMLMLVLGGNLLVLFVGWEGVGLCSYLLIGFWYKNSNYADAGKKAFIVNRIGDAGVLLGMFLLLINFGTLDFVQLKGAISQHSELMFICTIIGAALFVGAMGKSAQIPLHVWLPDAMAGPTPVSALIHAATMVTAGVYLMSRMFFLYDLAPLTTGIILVVASLTAFVAATTALVQTDIKKVLAYSTVSQLGFMFMGAASGAYWVAVFHLVTHAFFKACLFLGAGSVIHGCHHEQDMRKMGGLSKFMPITFITYAVSTLAIAGIYPFAGYQSKHAILEAFSHVENPYLGHLAVVLAGLASVTAILTAFYMARSVGLTFLGHYRGGPQHEHSHKSHSDDPHDEAHLHSPHESPWCMTLPLVVLAVLAAIGGVWLQSALPHYLAPVFNLGEQAHHGEGVLEAIKHSWGGILGVAVALFLYTALPSVPALCSRIFAPFTKLFSGKWYFDELYGLVIVAPLKVIAEIFFKIVDRGLIDGTVNGAGYLAEVDGDCLKSLQTGQVRHYAAFMFFFSVLILVLFFVL